MSYMIDCFVTAFCFLCLAFVVPQGCFSYLWKFLCFQALNVKFLLQKRVNVKNTIYEIRDNTGKMDVVGKGKWHNIGCKEGDKLRLFCFQLRTIDQKLKLTCGNHSFIQVGMG